MPDTNPIQVDQPQVSTIVNIPAANKDDQLTLTVQIQLTADDWIYRPSHQVFLDANDIYPAGSPDPAKLDLGTGSDLDGRQLSVKSKVALIYEPGGFAGAPPVYKYSISLDTGAAGIAVFEVESGPNNPTRFNSLILFKQL